MVNFSALNRLERFTIAREEPENTLLEMVELGMFVALLAPIRCGRSTVLRHLKARLEAHGALFILLRPDQTHDLPREVFLNDLLSKLKAQLSANNIQIPHNDGEDPYLELKNTIAMLPTYTSSLVIVAVDDLGRVEPRHLKSLLWVFRELHAQRADEGWSGPLGRLSVIVAGSRRLYELTVGHDDQLMSPFNIAEIYHLPDFSRTDQRRLLEGIHAQGIATVSFSDELFDVINEWTGGHPALIKDVISEMLRLGDNITKENFINASESAISHNRNLILMCERLQLEPFAWDITAEIFSKNALYPSNLEMIPESLRIIYWVGAVIDNGEGIFVTRSVMISKFINQKIEAMKLNSNTNEALDSEIKKEVGADIMSKDDISKDKNDSNNTLKVEFNTALFPEGLVREWANRNVVLFVGAGVSRAAGLPTWGELCTGMNDRILNSAKDEREKEDLQSYLSSESPLNVAQLLKERIGSFEYYKFLTTFLRKKANLSPIHKALQNFPLNLVLTTNFDKLLERTFRSIEGEDPPVIISTPQLAMIEADKDMSIVKLHGDIDHPESIILTADDYNNYFDHHHALREFLKHQFNYKTILFLGFGLKDPNFDLIFEEARRLLDKKGRPAYAIMVGGNPFEISRWKSRGIHIIDLPSFDIIPDYLNELNSRIKNIK